MTRIVLSLFTWIKSDRQSHRHHSCPMTMSQLFSRLSMGSAVGAWCDRTWVNEHSSTQTLEAALTQYPAWLDAPCWTSCSRIGNPSYWRRLPRPVAGSWTAWLISYHGQGEEHIEHYSSSNHFLCLCFQTLRWRDHATRKHSPKARGLSNQWWEAPQSLSSPTYRNLGLWD